MNYYGLYYRSVLHKDGPFKSVLAPWTMRKHKRLKGPRRNAQSWIHQLREIVLGEIAPKVKAPAPHFKRRI